MANGWGGARPGAGRPKVDGKKMPVRRQTAPKKVPMRQEPAAPRRMAVDDMLRIAEQARSHRSRRTRAEAPDMNPFTKPWFPMGAKPTGQAGAECEMAMDNAIQGANEYWAAGPWAQAAEEGLIFLGYPYLAELAQRTEYRVASETIATEMTRKWIKFSGTGTGTSKADKSGKIKELVDFLDELKVRDKYEQLAKLDGWFGRAHLFHDFGDDKDEELKTPIGTGRDAFTEQKIAARKLKLKNLQVVEPTWVYPTSYNAMNPLDPSWYTPQVWYTMGREIHRTRILTFIGREVPDMLKPAYAFGGIPLSQLLKPYVDNWLKTRESVNELIHSFSIMILLTDLQTVISPNDAGGLMARVAMFNALRDNMGAFIANKNTEDVKNVSAPVTGLSDLQAQSQEHIMSAARIPAVKYTGMQPKGLNATADGEIRVFYDTIGAYQNKLFRPNLQRTIDFAMISLWGARDPEITFEFEPLWEMSALEKADIRKKDAETGQILIDSGAIWEAEERQRVAESPDTPYVGLDVNDVPEVQEVDESLDPEDADAPAPNGPTPQDDDQDEEG